MYVQTYQDVVAFESQVLPRLLEHEAENCVILGVLSRLKDPTMGRPGERAPLLGLLRTEHGHVVAAGTRTADYPLCLSPCTGEVAMAFADRLADAREPLTGVIGEVKAAESFARAWERHVPYTRRLGSPLGVYQLDRVLPPKSVPGRLRQAGAADLATLAPFAVDFYREIGEPAPPDALERAICEGRLFVWCDGEDHIVSMAAWAGLTPNGVRVNFVYTPSAHRGRGFASNCVAALTRRLLESGRRFVFLFTDLTNPISNRVYQSIGYAQIGEHQAIHFDPRPHE